MQLFCGILRSQRNNALRCAQSACGAFPAHSSRQFASDSSDQVLHIVEGDNVLSKTFDAAEEGAPVAVHQLIGDPRTGIADDTTTMPWGHDVNVEWIWSSQSNGVNWYRYSMSGPDQLPHMYMDSRLSDHSKNLLYMLRCKDPDRWTIQALADKFRIRRQRVMAILALKEMQAHRIDQGLDMQGPLQPYTFRVPLQDFHVQPDGEPVDLADLVALQNEQQLQQQQHAGSATAAAGSLGSDRTAAEGLGSLDEFLAPSESSSSAEAQQSTALSSLAAAAGGQAADLAALMPQIAVTTQQLQLQLLQLLQQHHYSTEQLQRHLLAQVDVAEAYYNKHIAGTTLEQLLLASSGKKAKAKAKAAAGETAEGGQTAATRPDWLDFSKQRQEIQQLISALGPVLQHAGPEQEREAGRMLAVLKHALQQAAAAAPAGKAAAEEAGQQAPAATELSELLQVAASEPATFAAAFNQLERSKRQQLLELAPDAWVLLNIQGTDLRAALGSSSSSSGDGAGIDSSSNSSSSSSVFAPEAPGLWPGQVLPVVDVWGYEEVPRKQLAALQEQLPGLQRLLGKLDAACAGLGSSSRCGVGNADLAAVQQATQVFAGLVFEYDKVLAQQAALAAGTDGPPLLGPQQQRRLMRILRDMDMHAVDKLLLWETYFRKAGVDGGSMDKLEDFTEQQSGDGSVRRLKRRVHAQLQEWDEEAAAKGQPGPFDEYPDLPADVPASHRVDKDMAAAHLDAEVVGRQFHRGSGDRHFVRLRSYPKFEGYSLEEFDSIQEGELSALTRLATEREDNMMWKEFRERLLRNTGLTAPDLHQHLTKARPPKPRKGWSFVVHPVGGAARALRRKQLRQLRRTQYYDDDEQQAQKQAYPGDVGPLPENWNAAEGPAPAEPYVVQGDGWLRGLTEEEQVVAGYSKAKPRRRWYASTRSRVL